jgi:hypothetical protein
VKLNGQMFDPGWNTPGPFICGQICSQFNVKVCWCFKLNVQMLEGWTFLFATSSLLRNSRGLKVWMRSSWLKHSCTCHWLLSTDATRLVPVHACRGCCGIVRCQIRRQEFPVRRTAGLSSVHPKLGPLNASEGRGDLLWIDCCGCVMQSAELTRCFLMQ